MGAEFPGENDQQRPEEPLQHKGYYQVFKECELMFKTFKQLFMLITNIPFQYHF